jgi:hypothetical protein
VATKLTDIRLDSKWSTSFSPDEARKRIQPVLKRHHLEVSENELGAMQLRGGSQFKMRFLGSWFVSARLLPKRGLIIVESQPSPSSIINLHLEESQGIGIIDQKVRQKYETEFQQIEREIGEVLS